MNATIGYVSQILITSFNRFIWNSMGFYATLRNEFYFVDFSIVAFTAMQFYKWYRKLCICSFLEKVQISSLCMLHCISFSVSWISLRFHNHYQGNITIFFYFWIRIIAFWWAKIKKNNKNWKFPRSYNTARWNSYSVRFVEHAIIWMMQIKNLIILSLIEFNWNYE